MEKNVKGCKLIVDTQRPGLEKDLYLQEVREEESVEIFQDEITEGMTVVDIGANIGYYSLLAAQEVGETGEVLAFEPEERNFERLKKNIKLNNFSNIATFNKAVGMEKSQKNLLVKEAANMNRITPKNKSDSVNVDVVCLDEILCSKDVDAVRMDVQGYEYHILQGMTHIISENNLKIFIEIHPSKIEENYGVDTEKFWKFLRQNNFEIKNAVSHPLKIYFRSFFQSKHPPRRIYNCSGSIEDFVDEHSSLLEKGSFRAVLEN